METYTFTLQLKRLGKKKVKTIEYHLEYQPKTLKELIEICVKKEVQRYNKKREEIQLMPFLAPLDIEKQAIEGKIGVGALENTTLAKLEEATDNALLAHKDGLFLVFINDDEIKDLETEIDLKTNTTITFLRMTFLTGTYW
jgi:hypothetical protein